METEEPKRLHLAIREMAHLDEYESILERIVKEDPEGIFSNLSDLHYRRSKIYQELGSQEMANIERLIAQIYGAPTWARASGELFQILNDTKDASEDIYKLWESFSSDVMHHILSIEASTLPPLTG